jgi:uncharacterized protein YbcI
MTAPVDSTPPREFRQGTKWAILGSKRPDLPIPAIRRYGLGISHVGFSPFASRADVIRRTREKAAMPAPNIPLIGDALLVAVTDAMVAFHMRYYHRPPVTAKTLLLDGELLVCVLGGIYTDVEKTMIELQRKITVQETRSAFQIAMEHRFIDVVQRLSGRDVLHFISNSHVGPDMEVELFLLKPAGSEAAHEPSRD